MVLLRRCMFALAITCLPLSVNAQQSSSPKHVPALDVTSMDRSVDPCVDFFAYSCGGWIKNNPIPADQSSWDTYSKMQDENLARLKKHSGGSIISDLRQECGQPEDRRLLRLLYGREGH